MSSHILRENIRMRAILKESTANHISLESLINVDFRIKKIAKITAKMAMRHSIKQIYQNSADFCDILPEHSLDVVKQKCVGDF